MPNYRTQDPYERIPINQLARINQNDPWFGLGYLLAQGYNRQYDQRGVEKSVQELQNSLGPTQAERDNAQSAVLSQLPTMEEDYNQLNQYLDNALKSSAGYNANPAAQTLPEAPADGLYSAGNAANFAGQPAYNFGVGDARAYETDNRAAISALADAQAADRLRNFDINQWQANETAKLISQGRTPEQIDAAMAAMLPQAQALEQRNKDLDTQDALAMLGNLDLSAGYDPRAYQVIGRLAKSNPELATMLARDVISPRDEYGFNTQIAGQDNSLNNEIKLAKARDQIARDRQIWENNYTVEQLKRMGWNDSQISNYMLGNRGGSNRSGGGQQDEIASKRFEFANEQLEKLQEKADLNGGKLSPEDEALFNQYSNYINEVVSRTYGTGSNGNNQQAQLFAMADAARTEGKSNEEILAELNEQLRQYGYGEDSPYYQAVAAYLGAGSSSAAQPQQQTQPAQNNNADNASATQPEPEEPAPVRPALQTGANGLPNWSNWIQQYGVLGALERIGDLNRGADGLPNWLK